METWVESEYIKYPVPEMWVRRNMWATRASLRMGNKARLPFSFCILRNLSADFFQNIDISWESSKATITQVLVERGKSKKQREKCYFVICIRILVLVRFSLVCFVFHMFVFILSFFLYVLHKKIG